MKSTVSEKGQITIPKIFRDHLGILPGEAVEFEEKSGALILRKVFHSDPLFQLIGSAQIKDLRDSDQIVSEMRGEPYNPKRDGGA